MRIIHDKKKLLKELDKYDKSRVGTNIYFKDYVKAYLWALELHKNNIKYNEI